MSAAQWLDVFYAWASFYMWCVLFRMLFNNSRAYKLLSLISATLATFLYYLWCYNGTVAALLPNIQLRQTFRNLCNIFLLFTFAMLFKRVPIRFRVFATGLGLSLCFIAEAIMTFLVKFVWDLNPADMQTMEFLPKLPLTFANLLLYALSACATYWILQRTKPKQSLKILSALLALLLAFFIMAGGLLTNLYDSNDDFVKFTIVILLGLGIIAFIAIIFITKSLNKTALLAQKLNHVREMQTLESAFYLDLQEKTNEIRMIRHDINDQLQTVRLLLERHTEDASYAAQKVIDALDQKMASAAVPIYTENAAINAVLAMKVQQAEKDNIKLHTFVNLPKELPSIEVADLNLLFINLLNNAIDACLRLRDTVEKVVEIKASVIHADNIVIKTTNPFFKLERTAGGRLRTTKSDTDNHGFGLMIIEEIIKKYDGSFLTEQNESIFEAIVTIPIRNK